jgi:hypothetical protein
VIGSAGSGKADEVPLLEELPERFAELGSELIEGEGGDPSWHGFVPEPAMYGAGVDATGPAYLGKAQAARLAELLKPTGVHQRTSARDPGDLVDGVCGYGCLTLLSGASAV